MSQKEQGIYNKFQVNRNDFRDLIGGDRQKADYFVLDLTYDKFALGALQHYAYACREEYPELSKELLAKIDTYLKMAI